MPSLRQPHRRQRWIALWAVMALLFNQVAFAAHLCRSAPEALPHAQQRSEIPAHTACTHATPPPDDIACKAHCSHPADSNQQGKTTDIHPLAWIGQPIWNAVIGYRVVAENAPSVPTHRKPERWQLLEFCTLLL